MSNTVLEDDMEGVETVGESEKGNDASEVENDKVQEELGGNRQ